MKIGLIDADLIGRTKHRFPNLACEKISGYYKEHGHTVRLKTDYEDLDQFDRVFISKVFTDTPFPSEVLNLPNVSYGGAGFFFDKAPNLPNEIEHSFPDYGLYDDWINEQLKAGVPRIQFKEYLDYCIGFLTRGCFRKCGFCVNQKYDHVFKHSPLDEFYYEDCKKICLLDDNFFGCPQWKEMLQELIDTGKPFKFKQGLDERLLTHEKCEMLFNAKSDGDITFAFDKIEDYDLVEKQLKMIRKHTDRQCMFYVLVGFQSTDLDDVINAFKRIELLMKYHMIPYIMRYQSENEAPWKDSEFRGMYITLARWCNQASMFKKNSFRTYCRDVKTNGVGTSAYRYMEEFEQKYPDIASKYFDMKWGD